MWLLQPQLPKGIGLKIRDICTKYEKFVSFTQTFHRVGDDLVINGQKMWITNAFQVLFCTAFCMIGKFDLDHQADWMCLLANTREGNRKFFQIVLIDKNIVFGFHCSSKLSAL